MSKMQCKKCRLHIPVTKRPLDEVREMGAEKLGFNSPLTNMEIPRYIDKYGVQVLFSINEHKCDGTPVYAKDREHPETICEGSFGIPHNAVFYE